MKTGKSRRRRLPMADINVVPYIDVMLVLLVIFMITTPLLSQGINVDLPQAKAQPIVAKQEEPIIVSVDAQGLYYLNTATNPDQPIDATTLRGEIAEQLQKSAQNPGSQPRQILVKGDQNVDYGKVVQAMVLLQQAGANNVGLITTQPDSDVK